MPKSKIQIANEIRLSLEKVAAEGKVENGMYAYTKKLCGLCGIGSFALKAAFKAEGYDARVYRGGFATQTGGSHCWVVSDGYIWDLTATQFDIPDRVLVTAEGDKRYVEGEKITRLKMRREGWPVSQQPRKSILRKVLCQR